MTPSYSSNLAPNDYDLYLPKSNGLAVEKFVSKETYEKRLSQFCAHRNVGFYARGIIKLSSKY